MIHQRVVCTIIPVILIGRNLLHPDTHMEIAPDRMIPGRRNRAGRDIAIREVLRSRVIMITHRMNRKKEDLKGMVRCRKKLQN